MRDRNPPPSPAPRRWSPEERQIWLNAKGAPEHFRLTTVQEITSIQEACASVERARQHLALNVARAIKALDEFATREGETNFVDRVRATAFDARRHERATLAAIERLAEVEKFLTTLADYAQTPVHMIDIASEVARVASTLAFLRAQTEARYERPT